MLRKPVFEVKFRPNLHNPIFVEGLSGYGEVGRIAAQLLIDFVKAKCFAELYAPYFPDYVVIDETGICRLPRYEFYSCSTSQPNLVILIGDVQPGPENIPAHYELCSSIVDFAKDFGCNYFVTLAGFPVQKGNKKIYVAATSGKLAFSVTKKCGGEIYKNGRIVGAAGLILGIAKSQDLQGVCILGTTPGHMPDRQVAILVFRFLAKLLNLKI